MANERLDVYLGELRPLLNAVADAGGRKPGEYLRDLFQRDLLGQAVLKDQVREATIALAAAIEPDEGFDPANDPREGEALGHLAQLLRSAYAAQGIAEALAQIWTERALPQPAGLRLGEVYLLQLDELVDGADQPYTRTEFVEKLIGEEMTRQRGGGTQ